MLLIKGLFVFGRYFWGSEAPRVLFSVDPRPQVSYKRIKSPVIQSNICIYTTNDCLLNRYISFSVCFYTNQY
nr:MAG TPA: hypothetical protein [Caudoviricetes sp.]